MSDPREQLRQHVESLRLAGVTWLPRQADLAVPEPEPEPEPAATPVPLPVVPTALQTSLFAQAAEPTTPVPETAEERLAALEALRTQVAACTRCPNLASTRTQTVFGVGPLDPDLCFLGEAPGADEDRLGEPFVGAAGQLLNRIINACGMRREDVFIVNILRCLHGFTAVLTEDGWMQIQRIVKQRYPGRVMAVDASGRPTWARITAYHRSPRLDRQLVQVRLHSARQGVRPSGGVFTEDHEVLTKSGYKQIRDLDPQRDRIHSGTNQPSLPVRQAILGMLLGDARIARKTNSFSLAHCPAQKAYLEHKAALVGIPPEKLRHVECWHKRREKLDRRWTAHQVATPYFRHLGRVFYPNGRKALTPEALREFGAISLAYLFMDDGYMRFREGKSPLAEIATCGFSEQEVDLLREKIAECGIDSYRRAKAKYPRIHFNVPNSALLSRIIAPYVPESMAYKLLPEHREFPKVVLQDEPEPFFDTFSVLPAAGVYSRHCRTVYCISVEEHENFFTHAGVVHNCRPPGNRQPTPLEADNCRPYLERTLDLVKPRAICALGATAVQNLLGVTQGITRLRGRWLEYRGIPVMPTFHPAYLLRTPAGKKDVWEDMKSILTRLGRTVPGKG